VRIDTPIRLEIPSNPAVLFLVRALVKRLGERLGFSDDQVPRMILAIDEACTMSSGTRTATAPENGW
jgi:hypothetical protein